MRDQSTCEPPDPFGRVGTGAVEYQSDDAVTGDQRAGDQQDAARTTRERMLLHNTTSRDTHFVCITPGRLGPTSLTGYP